MKNETNHIGDANKMVNQTKQTAVEWLEEQIIKFHNWKRNPVFDENCFDEIELNKAIKQAKEMEKEQIFNAFDFGDYCIDLPEGGWKQKYESAEQYYNKTFGGNK